MNKKNLVYKNDLLKIVRDEWDDTRLDILDSDGNYFNYLADSDVEDIKERNDIIKSIINDISNCRNDTALVSLFQHMFSDVFKIEKYIKDEKEILKLKDTWGNEYVNRFGRHFIIIRE